MNALVLKELNAKHAELEVRAERLRVQWRVMPTGSRSTEAGKRVKEIQAQADSWRALAYMAGRIAGGAEIVYAKPS